MFVLKNRHVTELSGANCHVKLSHLKQLLKNIHPVMFAQFFINDEKIFTVGAPRNLKNHQFRTTSGGKIVNKDAISLERGLYCRQ